jgi:two-component system phosphate regulon response regulator PhoB
MMAKVLIVDDDANSVALLAYTLGLQGFEVAQAEDGGSALALIEQEAPDLVVLDVMLPDLSGVEVCRRIRDELQLPNLKVIMLSAKADLIDQDRGLEAGADAYLTKPAEPDLVIRTVQEALAIDPH